MCAYAYTIYYNMLSETEMSVLQYYKISNKRDTNNMPNRKRTQHK